MSRDVGRSVVSKIGSAVTAVGIGLLLLAPLTMAADAHGHAGHGLRGHAPHFAHHFRGGQFFAWPFYGGFFDVPPYWPASFTSYGAPPAVYIVAPREGGCRPSQETVTVPSEAGGLQQVTIRRCSR